MAGLSIFNIRRNPMKEERFRELFLSMHPKLIRYATTLMGDADEAKDIVSEVFGRAWEEFDSLSEEANAWLYTATRNACLNQLKHLKVEQTHIEGERMRISTPAGTTTSITLSDGTEVLLSANSRLEYAKNFSAEKREVTLVGEARFNVAKDASRPFIVRTEQIQAQVLGTVFDVKAYPQTQPDVTLYEGKVEVSLNGTAPRLMQPGEQASISKEGKLQLAQASADQGKWTEGEFVFDNRELMAVMQEIGSWYNISVVFHSRPLLEERIYFRMNRVKEVKSVLQVLNDMGIAKFEIVDDRIVVK